MLCSKTIVNSTLRLLSIGALLLLLLGSSNATTTPPPSDCVDSWSDLNQAFVVTDDDAMPILKTVVICPGAVLDATGGAITIDGQGLVTLQCGDHGLVEDSCVIQGGDRQFDIVGRYAMLRGLTFRGASSCAVSVETDMPGPATPPDTVFEQCLFEDNSSGDLALAAAAVVYNGGHVRFEDCVFRGNTAFEGAIDVHGGTASFDSCVFESNVATGDTNSLGGVVYAYGENGSANITNCCFVDNEGISLVFLRGGATILRNVNNYGDNTMQVGCNGILDDGENMCGEFSANSCGLTTPSATPSSPPSAIPSLVPSSGPSALPTMSKAPSNAPSSSPSSAPSSNPTSSSKPSSDPSVSPSATPSGSPSFDPSSSPSVSAEPSFGPTAMPSSAPSMFPAIYPSGSPSAVPSKKPSPAVDVISPVAPTPTKGPTNAPETTQAPTPQGSNPGQGRNSDKSGTASSMSLQILASVGAVVLTIAFV
ncbi:Similarities with uniprot P08640 Saccharomyces cerevisiae YIR019c STA1 [Seminavis robusta]|uniref:Circumsporozoite protein n=1 Tax=Seminavis robusta TaxID=568900 RepID=A0A9N8HZE8_9STRA|nr:Similarities with uniprot P08640 Saccharomyces cerevisiae YIR019c STA1 [Seminavis robusta]|eukprot:Sro2253_g320930.1 Similarities with uniprot P08640 Saccharomyces cerevisiae YIR019c STA1 (479) ;mRNA; f:14060-15496